MSKTEHSPTPWVYADINGTHRVVPDCSSPIAEPCALLLIDDYKYACLCVNSHDELVAALSALLAAHESMGPIEPAIRFAKQVFAKVKSE